MVASGGGPLVSTRIVPASGRAIGTHLWRKKRLNRAEFSYRHPWCPVSLPKLAIMLDKIRANFGVVD